MHPPLTRSAIARSPYVHGIPLFGPHSPTPLYVLEFTRIGLCYRRTPSPLPLRDPLLIHTDRMTSRLFLNLRSAGSSTPKFSQTQSVAAVPLGNRQATHPESTQATSGRTLTALNFDSTLSGMVSGVYPSEFRDQGQILSRGATETNLAKVSIEVI